LLESYLRLVASLVTPSPITYTRGCALKLLQEFLGLPCSESLDRLLTKPNVRVLRVYAYHILNDVTSPEGKACRKFLNKFHENGIHFKFLDELKEFMDNVQAYMMENRYEELRAHVERFQHNNNIFGIQDDLSLDACQQLISEAIRHEVEDFICVPVLPELSVYLKSNLQRKENVLRDRINKLREKPQIYFDIPVDKLSVSSWIDVVETMNEIDDMFLPSSKLQKLVEAANLIHAVYKAERIFNLPSFNRTSNCSVESLANERASDASESDSVLSGDDFLPIFIYVIVQSRLSYPLTLMKMLNALCDREKRMGESGYYLASYEAALEHLYTSNSFPRQ